MRREVGDGLIGMVGEGEANRPLGGLQAGPTHLSEGTNAAVSGASLRAVVIPNDIAPVLRRGVVAEGMVADENPKGAVVRQYIVEEDAVVAQGSTIVADTVKAAALVTLM